MNVKNTSRELALAALLLAYVYLVIIPEKRNKITFTHRQNLNAWFQTSSIYSFWIFQKNFSNLMQNYYPTPEHVYLS